MRCRASCRSSHWPGAHMPPTAAVGDAGMPLRPRNTVYFNNCSIVLLRVVLLVTWQRYKVLGMGRSRVAICTSGPLLQQRCVCVCKHRREVGGRCRVPCILRMPLQIAHLLLALSDTPD